MIIENVHQEFTWNRSPMSNGNIRCSQAESCPRQQAYVILDYEQDYPDTGRSQMAMDDGNLHEADVVNRLLQAGYRCWNYTEDQTMVHFENRGVRFRGHPDLYMETPEGEVLGVELKAYRDEIFKAFVQGALEIAPGVYSVTNYDRLTKRPWPLMGQIQLYLHSSESVHLGVERWALLMKNKNTAELAECIVTKDTEYIDNLINKWKGFWGLIQAGRLPERHFSDDSTECRRCVFRQKCWGLKEIPDVDGNEVIHVDGLSTAASLRREGQILKKSSEEMLEEARMAFLTEHIRRETSRIECDDMFSTVSERSRKGLDVTAVNMTLANQLEKGNISYEEYDGCFKETFFQEVRFRDRKVG